MSVKPILFNTEMVRAILEGRKTCTRRVLKQPFEVHPNGYITKPRGNERLCPYIPPYQPGDRLYVRETFAWCPCWYCGLDAIPDGCKNPVIYDSKKKEHGCYMYRASCEDNEYLSADTWHPSIHMPKEAARIWLKVTDVRVERLHDITDDEAEAEGANFKDGKNVGFEEKMRRTSIDRFIETWNSTIKKSDLDRYGWVANPYVYVIEFERCEKPPECILKGYDKAPDDGLKCLGYMYDDDRDELLPMCEKCSYQASYESEEEK